MKRKLRMVSGSLMMLVLAWLVDRLTKVSAEQVLRLHEPVPVLGEWFRLTLGYNTGVAFGLFANGGRWPLVVTGFVIAGLVIFLLKGLLAGELPRLAAWPIGLILGGAIANFADRLPDGRVTDFLDVGLDAARWPTFNLADSFIVVGAAILLWTSLINKHPEQDLQP